MRNNYFFAKDVPVDVHNKFTVSDIEFLIPDDNPDYRVVSRYDDDEDYENESLMDQVRVVFGNDFKFYFYDENNELIKGVKFQK